MNSYAAATIASKVPQTAKLATYYIDGAAAFFTCWNAQHSGCGVHSVDAPDAERNAGALERLGYLVVRTGRFSALHPRYFDFPAGTFQGGGYPHVEIRVA